MIQNEYVSAASSRRPILDRRFSIAGINTEIVLYGLLFVVSVFLHLWQLDVKAMHHDESIHAWMSYKFFNGMGPFTCAGGRQAATYCYDPVYHGPSLYVLTLLSYFLFGVGDAQARLPMALAGIALVPMAWTLRPFIGRTGAFVAAVLMTLSPSILYYTRFARHDALVLLWSLFMVVGLFKFLRHGGAANLALAAAGLALTWATHELVFILLFIGGSFFALRWVWEWRRTVFYTITGLAIGLGALFVGLGATATGGQDEAVGLVAKLFGPMLMLGIGGLLILPMSFAWEHEPIVRERLARTWQSERTTYWVAGAAFLIVFTLLFTTFFAYPLGFFDGWYQGIKYWLGSQHEFARGGQPWFYYLMLLPIYDLLALVFGLIGLGWLITSGLRRQPASADVATLADHNGHTDGADAADSVHQIGHPTPLFVFFLGYWFVQSFVGFSWAGEKMPWLLTHISLPASLLAAWVIGRLIDRVPWRSLRHEYGWSVPLLSLVLLLCTVIAAYTFAGTDQTTAGVQSRLQGLIPLVFAGFCVFGLLTIASWLGTRVVLRLAGLTIAAVLLLYGVRAATQVVYRTPDTPIDPLIYTQTAPDVPILVDQIEQLARTQTRNQRTAADPTGGLSLPVVVDGGAEGEGSLAWPLQWYLRDYTSVSFQNVVATPTIDPKTAVVVLYKPHVTEALRGQIEEDYVQTSEGVFNWWFPEFTGDYNQDQSGQAPARGYKSLGAEGTDAVLLWPFTPANWPTLTKYMLYRTLPLELKGREMVVFMRRDVAPGGAAQAETTPVETLQPETVIAAGQINNARGLTTDRDGNLYIADSSNHRIVVYNTAGEQVRTIGSIGNGDGQLNEPSGVAVDDDGNVYVADTWNGRIAKFAPDGSFIKTWGTTTTPFGQPALDPQSGQNIQRFATDNDGDAQLNEQNPLGFFGPRNVLVYNERVFITDTGNSRVVVTDLDGNFVQQFGNLGAEQGQMHEPIGLGVDEQGRVYVGDSWNGRIQIFAQRDDGSIDPQPVQVADVRGWPANTYYDPYIAVAPDGRIWATQGARNTIAEFDATQRYIRRLKADPELNGPKGVALDADGSLLVVNSGANEVQRFRLP